MKQKQHYPELTVMSGIAILFVLAIHGCGSSLRNFHPYDATYVDAGLWLRAISIFVSPAVPMFLFVSGFKYAANDTQTPYYRFLKKRLPRVLVSFAIINTLFWVLDSFKYMESFNFILLAKTYLHSWVGYSVAYQLWYIPMYCFVILLCPLARRVVPSIDARFCVFAVIGIVQRVLEVRVPVLATYPIRFISYPVFFEMGALAREKKWCDKICPVMGILGGGTYFLLVLALSQAFPDFSENGLTKYVVFYFAGTAAMYALSAAVESSRTLHWLGTVSYPVFLLHEPLIGRSMPLLLSKLNIRFEVVWLFAWVMLVLLVSVLIMQIFVKIRIDRVLWKFRI